MNSYQVTINSPVEIKLDDNTNGNDAVRIADVSNKNIGLQPNQLILGATCGTMNKSFLKMPPAMVQQELKLLNAARKVYSLTVANTPTLTIPANAPDSAIKLSPPPPPLSQRVNQDLEQSESRRRSSTVSSAHSRRSSRSPNQYSTPIHENRQLDEHEHHVIYPNTFTFETPYITGDGSPDIANEMNQNGMDLSTLKASLERLRTQRIETEKLRKEFRHKESIIRGLQSENSDLKSKISAMQEMINTQSNLLADLTVSEEKVKSLKEKEESLSLSLSQEQEERERDRLNSEQQIDELRREIATLQVRGNSAQVSIAESNAELISLRKENEGLRQVNERAESRKFEIVKKLENEYSELLTDRDDIRNRTILLDEELEAVKSELNCKIEENIMSENRIALLQSTIAELERNVEILNSQMADQEQNSSNQASELSRELSEANTALREERTKREGLEKEVSRLKQRAHEEMESHRHTRELLLKKGSEQSKMSAELFRLAQVEESMNDQLVTVTEKLEGTHTRLLDEMNKNSKLSQKLELERNACRAWARERSDLLSQFCNEERRFQHANISLKTDIQRTKAWTTSQKTKKHAPYTSGQYTSYSRRSSNASGSSQRSSAENTKHFYHYKSQNLTPIPFNSLVSSPRSKSPRKGLTS